MRKTTRRYEKYKDSNIEWLGEIPEHWELKRHKDNFQLVTKRCENRSLLKVGLENIESQTGRFIETESEFDGDGIEFKPNDILFGKLRPYLAKVYLSDFRGSAVGDIFVYRPRPNLNPTFSRHLMLSHKYIDVINSSTIGAKMPRVSSSFIANLAIATPPLSEQEYIANHLDAKISRIERIIQTIKTNIDKQKELRKTLINDVVTGKIKVIDN
ncbi:MAG: restriction endonuclease subunit S [Cyanobacteria bacterium REEB444]|nr:restriction endonuclease subunit S [Cyanobacteria bacterium REEB444]